MLLSRRTVLAMPLAGPALVVAAADSKPIELFDGRTTDGWLCITGEPFPKRCWDVTDGCLHAHKPPTGAFQDIRTRVEFESFDLTFEWKLVRGGNSGFKYGIQRVDTWKAKDDPEGTTGLHARARGLEFQLGDSETPDTVQRGALYSAGAMYGIYAPSTPAPVKPGEFNQGRIVYTPTRIEHWINGVLLVKADPASADFAARVKASKDEKLLARPRRAPIALQNHSSEVWFRRIQLRVL